MVSGACLGGLGFVAWSTATTLATLYGAWAVIGAALAMTLYDPVFSEVTRRFPDRFRQAITALTLVGGFASTLSFPAAAWLIDWLGWRLALAAIGIFLVVVVAPLHAWALPGSSTARGAAPVAAGLPGLRIGEAVRGPAFWLLSLAFTCHAFVAAALWAHVIPAFAAKGLDGAQSVAVVVWFGPAQIAGRLAFVAFGSGLSPRQLGIVVLAGLPLSFTLFALADGFASLLAFAVLFGISNGLTTIVRGHIVPAFFGAREVGRISGAMSSIALFARAAAPLGAAWLLLALHGYRGVGLVLAGLGLLAVLSFAAARPAPPAQ